MSKCGGEYEWFARGGDVARMGPFATQEEASKALMTTEGRPIEGAFVWPVAKVTREVSDE